MRVKQFFANSQRERIAPPTRPQPPAATQGIGPRATVKELPRVTEMDQRDVPSAVVEIVTPQGSLGTWLVSEYVEQPQELHREQPDLSARAAAAPALQALQHPASQVPA